MIVIVMTSDIVRARSASVFEREARVCSSAKRELRFFVTFDRYHSIGIIRLVLSWATLIYI